MATPNVIVLVLDSVRRDHTSTYGYERATTPNLSRLAKEGLSFTHAYATGSWTVPSHASLFTGQLPTKHGTHANNFHFESAPSDTLAGRLASEGYETALVTPNPWLTRDFGFDTGFDDVFDLTVTLPHPSAGDPRRLEVDAKSVQGVLESLRWMVSEQPLRRLRNGLFLKRKDLSFVDASTINEEITDWLGENRGDRPFFLFANYLDAHDPYRIGSQHNEFIEDGPHGELGVKWNLASIGSPPDVDADLLRNAYDSSLHYLDEQVGELVDSLSDKGLLHNTMIVVLGDHGQCLGEHGYWGHGTFLYQELLEVPLIVRPPGGCSRNEIESTFSVCDVFDLILDTVETGELELPGRSDDDRVVAESTGKHQNVEVPSGSVSSDGYRASVVDGRLFIRNLENGDVRTGRNGELITSEDLLDDLAATEQQALDSGEIQELNGDSHSGVEISDTRREQLEGLGYL